MLINEALKYGCEQLEPITEVAALETQWLLEWILNENRIYLVLNGEKMLSECDEATFLTAVNRRVSGEPLQYIIGTQEFMGLSFDVTPDVLIPRRDTECLVELVVERYREQTEPMTVLDLGSGSGAIGVSLAYFLKQAQVTCVDLSAGALEMTQRNGEKLLESDVKKRFKTVLSDMFVYLDALPNESQDLILSNPPYIPSADIDTLQIEVKCHEPRTALDGGADGLDYYRQLVQEAKAKLKSKAWMLFEVGHDQAEVVKQLFLDDGGYEDIQCYRDLQGILRMVGAHKK
jgi:release factor glutamine methyltransferase